MTACSIHLSECLGKYSTSDNGHALQGRGIQLEAASTNRFTSLGTTVPLSPSEIPATGVVPNFIGISWSDILCYVSAPKNLLMLSWPMAWDMTKDRPSHCICSDSDALISLADVIYKGLVAIFDWALVEDLESADHLSLPAVSTARGE